MATVYMSPLCIARTVIVSISRLDVYYVRLRPSYYQEIFSGVIWGLWNEKSSFVRTTIRCVPASYDRTVQLQLYRA